MQVRKTELGVQSGSPIKQSRLFSVRCVTGYDFIKV